MYLALTKASFFSDDHSTSAETMKQSNSNNLPLSRDSKQSACTAVPSKPPRGQELTISLTVYR